MKYSVFHSPLVDSINMKEKKNTRMGVLNLVSVEEIRGKQNKSQLNSLCCLFDQKRLTKSWFGKETPHNKRKLLELFQLAINYTKFLDQVHFQEIIDQEENIRKKKKQLKKEKSRIREERKRRKGKEEQLRKEKIQIAKMKYYYQYKQLAEMKRKVSQLQKQSFSLPFSPSQKIIYIPNYSFHPSQQTHINSSMMMNNQSFLSPYMPYTPHSQSQLFFPQTPQQTRLTSELRNFEEVKRSNIFSSFIEEEKRTQTKNMMGELGRKLDAQKKKQQKKEYIARQKPKQKQIPLFKPKQEYVPKEQPKQANIPKYKPKIQTKTSVNEQQKKKVQKLQEKKQEKQLENQIKDIVLNLPEMNKDKRKSERFSRDSSQTTNYDLNSLLNVSLKADSKFQEKQIQYPFDENPEQINEQNYEEQSEKKKEKKIKFYQIPENLPSEKDVKSSIESKKVITSSLGQKQRIQDRILKMIKGKKNESLVHEDFDGRIIKNQLEKIGNVENLTCERIISLFEEKIEEIEKKRKLKEKEFQENKMKKNE